MPTMEVDSQTKRPALSQRPADIEDGEDDLMTRVMNTITKAVRNEMTPFTTRLDTIENATVQNTGYSQPQCQNDRARNQEGLTQQMREPRRHQGPQMLGRRRTSRSDGASLATKREVFIKPSSSTSLITGTC
eukprot:TRINITY_DN95653_c0_g1_i1.p1 TRINITY_DN95653_c0_g1~~TRINITY_DN95653_c0_g1_i1.p1  ORF type:complete len:132 (-),score=4.08 TRINITY_DN95653_c0_g1_i1:670-1065(-)